MGLARSDIAWARSERSVREAKEGAAPLSFLRLIRGKKNNGDVAAVDGREQDNRCKSLELNGEDTSPKPRRTI